MGDKDIMTSAMLHWNYIKIPNNQYYVFKPNAIYLPYIYNIYSLTELDSRYNNHRFFRS